MTHIRRNLGFQIGSEVKVLISTNRPIKINQGVIRTKVQDFVHCKNTSLNRYMVIVLWFNDSGFPKGQIKILISKTMIHSFACVQGFLGPPTHKHFLNIGYRDI